MMRLLQIAHRSGERRVCFVGDDGLRPIDGFSSVYSFVTTALNERAHLRDLAHERASAERLDYDAIYDGTSDWRILPPIDHPTDPARLSLSGTGLTHRRSADQR